MNDPLGQLIQFCHHTTSHVMYAENAPCTGNMNKSSGDKQALLRNGWFETENIHYLQQMSCLMQDGTLTPKGI